MLEQVKEIIVEAINVDEDLIVPEAKLQEDLGIDSLSAVELAMELDDALANLKTVQDILNIVENK